MPIVEVLVPQMGEGLQEVVLTEFAKQPGERVRRDEVLYSMETDKASMEVESPHEGVLVEWLARAGDTLAIGAPVARMEIEAPAAAVPSPLAPLTDASALEERRRAIPPRTRAYAKEKGVSDDQLLQIPVAGSKLMPADIDAWLAPSEAPLPAPDDFSDRPLSPQDRIFLHRLKRSAGIVVPAVAKRPMDWGPIRRFADAGKARGGAHPPSAFNCIAWCVVQAIKEHPKFRSTLQREDTVREYRHVNLGIAVALPSGELTIAVVKNADTLSFDAFVAASHRRIAEARQGEDQADETTQFHLTYMGPYEITDGVPVLVAPAVGVLFIGSAFEQNGASTVNLVLSFDHRLVHGIEAAEFLRTIVRNALAIEERAGGD